MKIFKSFVNFSLLGMLLFSLSCDDRLPSEPGATIEKGSLELSYVFVNKTTSNPTIVGEILSDADAKTSIVVIVGEFQGFPLHFSLILGAFLVPVGPFLQ